VKITSKNHDFSLVNYAILCGFSACISVFQTGKVKRPRLDWQQYTSQKEFLTLKEWGKFTWLRAKKREPISLADSLRRMAFQI
jgi:hypothetical protein